MLVVLAMMTAASAQGTELIGRGTPLYLTDSLKLDSMYNYWNGFVTQHPKDDAAWRNLFEVCSRYRTQSQSYRSILQEQTTFVAVLAIVEVCTAVSIGAAVLNTI